VDTLVDQVGDAMGEHAGLAGSGAGDDEERAVLVDDGIATGSTALAAIDVLRRRGASRVVLAVPVAPREAVAALGPAADEVVTVQTPRLFMAIGQFYDDFSQTGDDEVATLLAERSEGSADVT